MEKIRGLLSPAEMTIFIKQDSPMKIQDYLDTLKINFEIENETNYSPRLILKNKKAHCFEGAVLAAAFLAFHGRRPLLMDFITAYDDEDHTIALFREGKYWGALSKTNHAVLKYRDPVYTSPRELAMSYFHEYYELNGKKSMRHFSKPFDLSRYPVERWITSEKDLDWLMDDIGRTNYYPAVPKKALRKLRPVSALELRALQLSEWKKPRMQ